MEKPLVSVIVPVYRVEAYLDDCVRSIVSQSYSNLEILLVDDGSDDACPTICEAWAAQDSRIRVLHKANGGLSDARNAGLEAASGDYIAFGDSDDLLHEQFVELLLDILLQENCGVAICGFQRFFARSELVHNTPDRSNRLLTLEECYAETSAVYDAAWNKLYRRDVIGKIRYPIGKVHEDMFTTYKILFAAGKIGMTEEKLYFYRQREESITGGVGHCPHPDMEQALWERLEFFEKRGDKLYGEALIAYLGNLRLILNGVKRGEIQMSEQQQRTFIERRSYVRKLLLQCRSIGLVKKTKLLLK